ncbi:solute carrier family 66 member 3-like [Pollicipes pollicipes]|uniref:solute carrier family 66 member 3-like n=1 Tax=Pollicipes pollicipes TaxID=41117 RepID=UPI001884B623|nr:solute carrier family 66 member 3-like [Pollicipes pollicipes]
MAPLVVACDWISIVGSLVLKLPQIAATLRSGSARGLSLQSLLLELTGFTINFCYNAAHGYPLLSYFEYALLIPQDVLLVLLTLRLSGQLTAGWVATLALATGDVTMLTCFCVNLALNVLVVLAVVRFRDGPPEEAARKKAK